MEEDKKSTNSENGWNPIKPLAILFKEVGLPGFLVIILTSIFWLYSSKEQKERFIDRFILLERSNTVIEPCVIVIVTLVALLIISSVYSKKMLGLRKAENNRIGKEKSELQALLLKTPLFSSDEK